MPDKRTYADRAVYLRKAVTQRRKKLRAMAREYKGGKCILCGYDKCPDALEFHHRDPSQKEFTPSRAYKRSWDVLKIEIDKCDLLCANCHREAHAEMR